MGFPNSTDSDALPQSGKRFYEYLTAVTHLRRDAASSPINFIDCWAGVASSQAIGS